ncbi:BamA/TamA family outer membrane protein [Aurantibacter crassamenti]|uniref:translocation and assembly module lipoprotein TamL n=1 Tax=Aurantibacter crassamenti TaxID=1837375 RepID=UPI00193ADB45|nr:BamA/TamA family outer membrane protein [Aurantibacter crassamenti]MBM1107177.1 BamA/TamA family outer membrane protein [Aurantibacter crassamenti]
MKNNFTYRFSIILLFFLGLYSCSVSKYIPEDEVLYAGSELEIQVDEKKTNVKKVKEDLNLLLQPQENSTVLGMRLGLYYHFKAQKKKPGFLNKWLNKKFGEAPVYLSEVNAQRIEELLLNRLDNRGFFYSKVNSEVDSSKNSAGFKYTATLPKPYTLEAFELKEDSLPIYNEIKEVLADTQIKSGNRFDLELLKFERQRIDTELKQRGYYNFNPDFLIFEADTNRYANRKFDLLLRLKQNVPAKSIIPYTIDSITVYPKYAISDTVTSGEKTSINGIHFIQNEEFFKPKKLEPYILFQKGQKYNANIARLTSNRLSNIGSYKFVNTRFTEKDSIALDAEIGSLDADIYLSPLTKRSVRAELQAVTKSNGFAGPGIAVTYSNRNLFKGGETLSLSTNFSYETQLSGGDSGGLSSIAGGLKADLIIPRLVPFSPSQFKYAVPKTKISLGADVLNRTKLYTLTSFNSSFGYTWKANKYVFHELNPISINYVNLANTTPEFEEILNSNPFLKQSFEQQFIAGLNYTFTYNELVDTDKSQPIFVTTSLDVSGNMLNLVSGGNEKVLGLEYAQYAKVDIDFRYYLKWGKEQALVSRVFAGWGLPYGNSTSLPFVKQFFSGGPYSVRAFKIRSLGPGTFTSDDTSTTSFFDQSGNLRLEGNLEFRFPIWSYLKGALFADAGNVWLTNNPVISEDESEEGIAFNERLQAQGKFGPNWYKDLGVGVGLGLRVDIQSFVIRLDLASPIRVPYLPEGERGRTPFFDGGDDNLIFNFAIGYPF